MLQKLVTTLAQIGMPTHLSSNLSGSRVLLLPHGGRILGLFTPSSGENFLWTHPALQSAESARAFYESGAWHNSGGDRTWLSPEIDFFFPKYPDLTPYWQPRELDPGRYVVVHSDEKVSFVNRLMLTASRSSQQIELQITKSVGDALNPLRNEMQNLKLADCEYAGYTLQTSLEFLGEQPQGLGPVGLWNLLQLPLGGELLVATHRAAKPTMYMGSASGRDLTVTEHLMRYKMHGPDVMKFGISALRATGRAGYVWGDGERRSLVVRNFSVDPSGEYVDAPKNQPTHTGDAVQGCCVRNEMGDFSELEYHVPAIGGQTGRLRSDDTSQVWAFRGPARQIHRVAENLLGTTFELDQ